MKTVTVEKVIPVPPENIWSLIGNFSRFPGEATTVTVHQQGNPQGHGAGLIRTITSGSSQFVERIETVDPPNSYSYSLLSGAPVRNYRGRAEVKAAGKGTRIRWSAVFSPLVPGTGWMLAWVTRRIILRIMADLEKESLAFSETFQDDSRLHR